ncbi:MAG: LarC family nickel insertion protein [Betaproteobacteria bacterium]
MFIAAVTDAFPQLREGMLEAIGQAGLPAGIQCRFDAHRDHTLTGSRFVVDEARYRATVGHLHHRGEHHHHRHFADIRARLLESDFSPEVTHHAVGIFTLLAVAEGRIHGMAAEEVSFHEIGEWDSIADIVGAAWLITALAAESWSIGTLPLGSGFVQTAHGKLPVPVPAVSLLLEGFTFAADGLIGERITPTGAAIVRYLNCAQEADRRPRRLLHNGYGFGTRSFTGLSNVLRVMAFAPLTAEAPAAASEVAVIQFEVDDQTPEDLAIALDRLRSHPAVLDVLQSPVFGKKGRIAAHVQVLADPQGLDAVNRLCFLETTTLGLRHQLVARETLRRDMKVVRVGDQAVRVKLAQRSQSTTAKVESDDTAQLSGFDTRSALRRSAEAESLKDEG